MGFFLQVFFCFNSYSVLSNLIAPLMLPLDSFSMKRFETSLVDKVFRRFKRHSMVFPSFIKTGFDSTRKSRDLCDLLILSFVMVSATEVTT